MPVSAEEANAESSAAAAERAKPQGRRILVVDDNTDSAVSLAMLLRIEGNETFTAHDGVEAVAEAEKHEPDVILLDIGLPKMSGHEVCRHIRRQPWGQSRTGVSRARPGSTGISSSRWISRNCRTC